MKTCANCGTKLEGSFCHTCGQDCRSQVPDLLSFLRSSFADYVDVDSRVVRSLRDLFVPPGKMTADYLAGRRQRYLPPFSLFFAVSVLFLFALSHVPGHAIHLGWTGVSITTLPFEEVRYSVSPSFPLEDLFSFLPEQGMKVRPFEHAGAALLSLVPLLTLVLKAFFPGRLILEHLVFSLHLYAGCLLLLLPGTIPVASVKFHDLINLCLNGFVLCFLFLMVRRVYGAHMRRTMFLLGVFVLLHVVAMLAIAAVITRNVNVSTLKAGDSMVALVASAERTRTRSRDTRPLP